MIHTIQTLRPSNFESNLISNLLPIRQFALAISIYHFFKTGLFDTLNKLNSLSITSLAESLNFEKDRLEGFLKYLRNENLLNESNGIYSLSDQGKALEPFRGWYVMLIGGYAETFLQMGDSLIKGADSCTRNATQVGIGSCGISHYDAIPLTRSLMNDVNGGCHRLLDLGCGNGAYLSEFCKALPEIEAWGIEPDQGGYEEAKNMIEKANLSHRVKIFHADAISFLESDFDFNPDFIVLGFVLHEILGQEDRKGVIRFLKKIIQRFPSINLIVIEVDDRIDDPTIMKHGLALAYYNPYFLLHYFTRQKLTTDEIWTDIFHEAGLMIKQKKTTDLHVDSTRLEIGYLLNSNQ